MTMIPNTKIMIPNTNNAVQLDSKIGTLHLELLGYESGDRVYFRCLEGKGYKLSPKNKSYVMGQIDWDELARLQAQGYDIFLGVNGGNCDNDVVECRALFLEWDDIDKEEQWRRLGELAAAGFPEYSFVVETRRSLHAYWVLEECLPPDVWKVLQRELIKATDSDPTIKNPSRFMRLGGSLYIQRGTEPFPCQLHLGTGQKINLARLKHGFRQITPPPENPQTEVQKTPTKNAINLIPFLAKNHQLLIETGAKTGSRNARGYALACDLIGVENWLKERGFSPQPTAQDLFMLYCQRCPSGEGWCSTEWEKIWQSALKSEPKPCCNNNVLNARLKRIAGVKNKSEEEKQAKKSVAKLLIEIAESECELWLSNEGDTWADIYVDGVRHSYPVRSGTFKQWLSGRLWREHDLTTNSEALQAALLILENKAKFGGAPKRKVFLRVGEHKNRIYLDLVDERNRVVEISDQGWLVIESNECPVRFYRCDSQQPLPLPEKGGNLEQLWEFMPIACGYRLLLLAWLGFSLIPTGAKPILTLHGPKGAGKSTTATFLKRLVDPGVADLLPQVGDSQAIATNARRRLILAYDNISSLSTAQQDTLCRVSTGASFAARKLYTDLEEIFYSFTRPQILTSVDCVPTRSDLLDRCLLISLDRIDESLRLPEGELWKKFNSLAPALLGAILDLVVAGLGNLSTVNARLPRMAEFARFGIAALGNSFLEEYRKNIANAEVAAVEANPVASAIAELVQSGDFEGTATQLLAKLQSLSDCGKIAKLTSRGLGRLLSSKAFVQDLQAVGVSIDSYRTKSERGWVIKSMPTRDNPPTPLTFAAENQSLVQTQKPHDKSFCNGDVMADNGGLKTSPTSQTSQPRRSGAFTGDIIGDIIGVPSENVTNNVTTPESGDIIGARDENVTKTSPKTSPLKPRPGGTFDVGDVYDVSKPTLSDATNEAKNFLQPDSSSWTKQQKPVANVTTESGQPALQEAQPLAVSGDPTAATAQTTDPYERLSLPNFNPGDKVVYTGNVSWIVEYFGRDPALVLDCVNGCLYLQNPKGGASVPVLSMGWVLAPAATLE